MILEMAPSEGILIVYALPLVGLIMIAIQALKHLICICERDN